MSKKTIDEKENTHSILFRCHKDDFIILKKLLADDKLSVQQFFRICVQTYLRADTSIMKVIKMQKELDNVPDEVKDKYALSQRDRQALLDEIDNGDI